MTDGGLRPRVLVTGGSGFLGRHLALALRDGNEVILAARNNKQNAAARGQSSILETVEQRIAFSRSRGGSLRVAEGHGPGCRRSGHDERL